MKGTITVYLGIINATLCGTVHGEQMRGTVTRRAVLDSLDVTCQLFVSLHGLFVTIELTVDSVTMSTTANHHYHHVIRTVPVFYPRRSVVTYNAQQG